MASFRERVALLRRDPVFPLTLLMAAYYFLQGMGGNPGVHRQALELYLKNALGLSAGGQAEFIFFITIPWMVKPLYGILSDSVPIFGYRRASYFILASGASILSYALIAFAGYSYGMVLALYAVAMAGFALSDVLCDAVMVEKGKPLGATDRLQGAQWAAIACAGIILTFVGGYVAEFLPFRYAVLISAVFPVLVVAVTLRFLKEKKAASTKNVAHDAWRGIRTAAKMPSIWGCASFIFLYNASPGISAALYNYQQDVLKFSQIDIGTLRTVSGAGLLVGALIFTLVCRKFSERLLLHGIVFVGAVTMLAYLWYENFSSALLIEFFTGFTGASVMLGVLTLAARVCPAHAEGTVFALLMSVYNLGAGAGNVIGGTLYNAVGYRPLVIASASITAVMWFLLPLVGTQPIRKPYFAAAGVLVALVVFVFLFRAPLAAYFL